jgi:hypothetical protein
MRRVYDAMEREAPNLGRSWGRVENEAGGKAELRASQSKTFRNICIRELNIKLC